MQSGRRIDVAAVAVGTIAQRTSPDGYLAVELGGGTFDAPEMWFDAFQPEHEIGAIGRMGAQRMRDRLYRGQDRLD